LVPRAVLSSKKPALAQHGQARGSVVKFKTSEKGWKFCAREKMSRRKNLNEQCISTWRRRPYGTDTRRVDS